MKSFDTGKIEREGAGDRGLVEKYLHSRGAGLLAEGRPVEAIVALRAALAREERAYTRCDLSRALARQGDIDGAIGEMNRAIELAPAVADYYLERSLLRRTKGEEASAAADERRALLLDPFLSRKAEVASALGDIDGYLSEGLKGAADRRPVGDARLSDAVRELNEEARRLRKTAGGASCSLPCPAYCCHFDGDLIRHGVAMGPWKLQAVRRMMGDRGVPEEAYLDSMDVSGIPEAAHLFPPDLVIRAGTGRMIYFPSRRPDTMDPVILDGLPRARDYGPLLWTGAGARACNFLEGGRCAIYDLADEPTLPACRDFLCFTGYAFLLLDTLGLVEGPWLEGRTMRQLNAGAVEGLIALSEEVLRNGTLSRMRREAWEALEKGCDMERAGDERGLSLCLERYGHLSGELRIVTEEAHRRARRRMGGILSPGGST